MQAGEVTEAVLAARLEKHVEQIDVDMVRAGGGRGRCRTGPSVSHTAGAASPT